MMINVKMAARMAGAFFSTLVTVQAVGLVLGLVAFGLIGFPLQEGVPAFGDARFGVIFLLVGLMGTLVPSAIFSLIIVAVAVLFRRVRYGLFPLVMSGLVLTVLVYTIAVLSTHVWDLFSIFSGILLLVSTVAAFAGAGMAYLVVGDPMRAMPE